MKSLKYLLNQEINKLYEETDSLEESYFSDGKAATLKHKKDLIKRANELIKRRRELK